jgi:hypothetical protein
VAALQLPSDERPGELHAGSVSPNGYSERELIELQRERQLAEQLDELSRARATLNEDITRLKDNIVIWRDQRVRNQGSVYLILQARTAAILAKDVHTEAEFTEESDVYFDSPRIA